MVKHIHWSQLLETHPLSDKVTRLFLTLKFQFQFFLSVSSTLMLRDLAVRWPGTFKGPSSGPATFKRLFISQCHFQGTIQRTDTAHKIALQELDQQTSRSTLQLWCGGTWWSDDLALLLDLTIFLCIRKISWRRQRRQWCWWSATRDVTATQCTTARPQSAPVHYSSSALVLGYTCLDLPRTKPLPSLLNFTVQTISGSILHFGKEMHWTQIDLMHCVAKSNSLRWMECLVRLVVGKHRYNTHGTTKSSANSLLAQIS